MDPDGTSGGAGPHRDPTSGSDGTARLAAAMLRDRRRLGAWLDRLQRRGVDAGTPEFQRFERQLEASTARLLARRRTVPTLAFEGHLPIHAARAEIVEAIAKHPVVVVSGATGSGKSTQLPKICLEAGRGVAGLIGHTQPRRIAAQSIAQRVAAEIGTAPGALVGYQIRFVDRTGPQTLLKLMTDGVLLRELESDPLLERYDTLIIDEAHERTLNIDFLLGVCRRLVERRPELRVIVTSATIETERIATFFAGAPIIEVQGRSYPVEVRYRAVDDEDDSRSSQDVLRDAIDEALDDPLTASGDVLVFLPGEKQIREAQEMLTRKGGLATDVLPLYSRLSFPEQERVFAPHGRRRVILATNVAETSLTIPGVRAVIDTGLARTSRYSLRAKIQRLPIEPISQANAEQRKGRCGREAPGLCIRLYSELDFGSRPAHPEPEIRRTNLASLILQMAALNLGAPSDFPFVDPPDTRLLNDGYRLLQELRAVDDDRRITRLGRQMASLPLDPRLSRALIESSRLGCLREILVVAAFLSLQDPRERPPDRTGAADEQHAQLADPRSDFRTVLNLWDAYLEQSNGSTSALRRWCRERFLSYRRMREWQELRDQLLDLAAALQLRVNREPCSSAALHQALLSGFLDSIGVRDDARTYLGARGTRFTVAPGTPLAKRLPHWIMAASLIETDRLYARMVGQVQPSWIEAAGSHLVRRQYTAAEWSRERGMVLAAETTTLFGRVLSSGRRVDFATIDPPVAHRIFVEEALLRGQSELRAPFIEQNAERLAAIAALEAKLRRRDLVADDATLADFYAARIPQHVASTRTFERWVRSAPERERELVFPLEVASSGLLPDADSSLYPEQLAVGASTVPLAYVYDPTREDDGVTVRLPLALVSAVSAARAEWLVPGYLHDKVVSLMRGLPKEMRRALVPIPDAAAAFCANATFGEGSLYASLAAFVTQRIGTAVDSAVVSRVPRAPWLDLRFLVVFADGSTWGQGRDIARLRDDPRLVAHAPSLPESPWHRDDVRRWDFGDWPETVDVSTAGMVVRMHPGIEDAGAAVRLRTYATASEARDVSRRGLTRLAALELASPYEHVRREGARDRDFVLLVAAAGFGRPLLDELADRSVADAVLGETDRLPRTGAEFAAAVERGRAEVYEAFTAARRTVIATLEQLRGAHAAGAALTGADADVLQASLEAHLDRLFAPGWLRDTPRMWFERLAKYAQAATRRAELALTRRPRHAALEAQVAIYDARLRELDLQSPAAMQRPARQELRWMIEEFRISLYAQELRTLRPVSAQRLDALVDAARREASGG